MTVKEAILSFPGLSDIADNFIEKLLLDRSLVGAIEYVVALKPNVELCAADCYAFMLNSPDFSEGGLRLTLSRNEIRKTAIRLYRLNSEYENATALSGSTAGISRTDRW